MAKKEVVVLVGAGSIGQAIARRIGAGKHVVLADISQKNAETAAKTLEEAGFDTSVLVVDLSSRASIIELVQHAQNHGTVMQLINAAGVSPSQASVETILRLTCMARRSCWKSSARSSAKGDQGLSFRPNRGTGSATFPPRRASNLP